MAYVLIAVISVLLVALVAWPLLTRQQDPLPAYQEDDRRAVEEELQRSLDAIREIDMDHRAGNLSDEDFEALDRDERARAVELMRRRDALAGSGARGGAGASAGRPAPRSPRCPWCRGAMRGSPSTSTSRRMAAAPSRST
jgi:hypothetical protein